MSAEPEDCALSFSARQVADVEEGNMFDTTCADRRKWAKDSFAGEIPPDTILDSNACVGSIVWEEHCVECGQPECFRMCRMYERSYDGKCKRFESGIVPFALHGRLMFGCAFRKWAKLEGQFSGGITTLAAGVRLSCIDRFIACIVQLVNRWMAFIPGRIGAITIYRRVKLWMNRFANLGSSATVEGLVLRCKASRRVKLHLALICDDESLHDEVFDLNGEWQTFTTVFRPVHKGTRFLLFSTEEEPFKLVIETLELMPKAPKHSVSNKECRHQNNDGPAKFVKCLAWDLDNTLWKGILVENGPDNVIVNEDAVKLIKILDSRGILNTILSKNDYEPAWQLLEKLGLAEYFVFPTINWLPKSANLEAASKTINIGLDTFAFVDDSPFERGEVGERLPMVRIFKDTEINELSARPEFNPPMSSEGANRRLSYQKEMQRIAAAQVFAGDYTTFLRSCEIVLTLFPLKCANNATYERCYELIQRTNQLTLAGRRYTPEQFTSLISPEEVEAWGIRCHDKYGDYGIVGVVIAKHEEQDVSVDEFVMSCRVAKKQCEYSVVHALAKRAAAQDAVMLKTRIIKTGRNTALVAAFDEMPFVKTTVDGDKAFVYELKLQDVTIPEATNKVVFQ